MGQTILPTRQEVEQEKLLGIKIRIRNGLTCEDDATTVTGLIDDLTWNKTDHKGQIIEQCKHCGGFRLLKHAELCPARMVY